MPRIEALGLFLCLATGLGYGAVQAGVAWDEVSYFEHSDHILAWWNEGAPLSAAALSEAWAYDRYLNPHPPLMRACWR